MVVTYTKMIFFAGYGNIVPKTVQGRLFCVLYALIGIPGTCLTLKSIGDKITELFTKLITNFEKRVLKRSHQTQKVELKVAMTTIVVTVLCLLPLMALLVHVRHKEWSLYRMFLLHFHDLKYNWFRWLLTAISVQCWSLTCTSGVCGSRFRIEHILLNEQCAWAVWAECARCAVTAREERKEVFRRKIK